MKSTAMTPGLLPMITPLQAMDSDNAGLCQLFAVESPPEGVVFDIAASNSAQLADYVRSGFAYIKLEPSHGIN